MAHVGDQLLPERVIYRLLRLGVDAITEDLGISLPGETVIDDILRQLEDDAEKAKARAYWAEHPPDVVQNYPRMGINTFPLYAVTLTSESDEKDYIGVGEHDTLDDNDVKIGRQFSQWTAGKFTIYVYAEHPDICAWYYRILRRIVLAGFPYMVKHGLDKPTLDGSDLVPDPRYTPDNMFVRRLTVRTEYDETWTANDRLWLAINAGVGPLESEEFITDPTQIEVKHEDLGGGVKPRFDIEPLDQGPDTWDPGC